MNERVLGVLQRLEEERGAFWNVPRGTGELLAASTLNVGLTFNVDCLHWAKKREKVYFSFPGELRDTGLLKFDYWLQLVNKCKSTLNVAPTFNVKVLEIGTSNGYSGIWIAAALLELGGGELVTVESHAGRFELAKVNFLEAGVSDFVKQIKGHAPEVFETDEFAGKSDYFDLIFIDSTKMEYVRYLDFVLPMLKKGGLLVADNCVSHRDELGEFFAELERLKEHGEIEFHLKEMDSGLMVVKKK